MCDAIRNTFISSLLVLVVVSMTGRSVVACSTFKLQKGDVLIYGHNLNQGDIGVPGMVFVNKRGIFKTGRTWTELTDEDWSNPSSFSWISRYGSVTFNVFGRDLPDGGMNEAGLYIWEMNEDADYPKNDNLPKLNQMSWMQFVLDSYSTVDEAIRSASEVEIDGWGWHYFVGDSKGRCAAIAFIDGKVVVNRDKTMPVPGLFNTPYDRELERLKYYKGFGGLYEPDLSDFNVPRFVKTAVMVRDYNPTQDPVDYGLEMLQNLKVYDVPEWSILFDVRNRNVYFRTRVHPELKHFSISAIDFSNTSDVLIVNMDLPQGGDVRDKLHSYSNEEMRAFTEVSVVPILPEEFFTSGGLTIDEYLDRLSSHSDTAASEREHFFKGRWKGRTENGNDSQDVAIDLRAKKDAVFGRISTSREPYQWYELEHLQLIGKRLTFTFRTRGGMFVEGWAVIEDDKMKLELWGIEESLGSGTLARGE